MLARPADMLEVGWLLAGEGAPAAVMCFDTGIDILQLNKDLLTGSMVVQTAHVERGEPR